MQSSTTGVELSPLERIRQAEAEVTRRLAVKIQPRTIRRLKHLANPPITSPLTERDFIQMALDERERSDHFRLKLVKRTLERKRELTTSPSKTSSSTQSPIPNSLKE
jgi:hypothetical protein